MQSPISMLRLFHSHSNQLIILLFFFFLYVFLAWLVCGGENWWVIDYVDGQNVFYGDDAYRFFLSRSFLVNPDLYTYNFVLPGALVLDGTVTALTNGDLFFSRCVHAIVGAVSLVLLFDSAKKVGATTRSAFAAVLVLGLLPRYSLMSISFYGEAWLGGFICLSIWLFVQNKTLLLAIVASLLPLLRPEGVFFLGAYGLYFILKRNWSALGLLILPGSVYFLYLIGSLNSLSDYNYWRIELRTILSKLSPGVGKWELFGFYSAFYVVPAAVGCFLSPMRKLWPVILGGVLWLAWFQGLVIVDLATVESRYAFPLYPLFTISWAVFFTSFGRKISDMGLSSPMFGLFFFLLVFFVISFHLFKMSHVQKAILKDGYVVFFRNVIEGDWENIYPRRTPSERKGWGDLNEIMIDVVNNDPGTDKIAIYDSVLFYKLDPHKIPDHVTVGFLTSGYMVFHVLLDGQTFIQHPGGNMYSYLKYGEPDFGDDEARILVADIMPLSGYPYTWKSGNYELYLFSYEASSEADTDIDKKPNITPQYLRKIYKKIRKSPSKN